MLMCTKAYYGEGGKIYCTDDVSLCGHQKYCDMSMKYKLTTTECSRNGEGNGKKRKTSQRKPG